MLPLVTAFRLTVSFAVNTPLLVILPSVVVREISLPASTACTLILPVPVVTLTVPEVALTFSSVVTSPFVLDKVTFVPAFNALAAEIPVTAFTVTSPFSAVTVSFTDTAAFLLNNVTLVPACTAAFVVTSFCAVTSTSPFTDLTAPFKVALPSVASTLTFWSAVATPPRTILPLVAPTVIVPPSAVADNVPAAVVSILPFAV